MAMDDKRTPAEEIGIIADLISRGSPPASIADLIQRAKKFPEKIDEAKQKGSDDEHSR